MNGTGKEIASWYCNASNIKAHNHILPFTTFSTKDIDHKYKSMIVFKLDELQEQAIAQLMHDLPRVLKVYYYI